MNKQTSEAYKEGRCLAKKKRGMRAFVARPNSGIGENRSVVIVGNEEMGWKQGVKFWDENHFEIAEPAIWRFRLEKAIFFVSKPKTPKTGIPQW